MSKSNIENPTSKDLVKEIENKNNVVQLYLNSSKTIKAYPKSLASEIYMDDGSRLTDHISIGGGLNPDKYYSKDEVDDLLSNSKTELEGIYVKKEAGKGLSSNDFTTEEKEKLALLQMPDVTKAYVDSQLSSKADKEHKHSIIDIEDFPILSRVATSGNYNDLINKPEIPVVTNDLTDELKNKYDKAYEHSNVKHFDGDYESLTNKPEIPVVDVNKSYVDTELSKKSSLIHEHEVSEIIGLPNNIATEEYVDSAISKIEIDGVDLSNYATKDELNKKADSKHIHQAENVEFANDQIVVESLGGIKTGETLQGLSIEQVLSKLIFKHVNHSVSASTYPNGGVYECGTSQPVTSITAIVSKKTNPITKIEFFDEDTCLETKIEGVSSGGIFTISDINIPVTSDKVFTVKATANGEDGRPLTLSATTNRFNFVYPYYQGLCNNNSNINEELVKSLDKKIELKGNKTLTVTSKFQKLVFAYPKSYGKLKQIFDSNNFDVTNTFEVVEVTMTGLDNKQQQYYVYVNSAFSADNFTFKFNY